MNQAVHNKLVSLLDKNGLKDASKCVFYNTIKWILQKLKNTAINSQQITKLKEYKTTLIDSVVTEKVGVCNE
jgi:hypothetical protein